MIAVGGPIVDDVKGSCSDDSGQEGDGAEVVDVVGVFAEAPTAFAGHEQCGDESQDHHEAIAFDTQG